MVAVVPPDLAASAVQAASTVCPFTSGEDETQIAERVFSRVGGSLHPQVGRYATLLAAYAPSTQDKGSSGGIVTWLLCELLDRGLIDAAIHVGPAASTDSRRFFAYRLSRDRLEVQGGSTSFYYPVSMDEVLAIVRQRPGRYAITGVPCFHKALRRLRRQDAVIDERIKYQVGIVCGQMKSAHYLEYLAGLAGAKGPVQAACFRRKVPGRPANDYAFEATVAASGDRPEQLVRILNSRIGVNWGMGYFKPQACDFCDDVLAETADIAAMDAWLPQYVRDGNGWSLVVTRTQELAEMMDAAAARGDIVAEMVEATDVVESQRGGFNHRQQALPYRLHLHRRTWLPPKRFSASADLHWVLKVEQRLREYLRAHSRSMWIRTGHQGNMAAFVAAMRWPERVYKGFMRLKRRLLSATP